MLKCHIIEGPDLKMEVIESLKGLNYQWIVSDLETKFWMQSVLRKDRDIICSDDALRASELWQGFLSRIDPSWRILPSQLSKFIIEKWMVELLSIHPLNLSSKDCGRAYQTIGQILPLLGHSLGDDAIQDWFEESEGAKERWYEWYQMGKLLWAQFVDKKIIPMDWMKALLLNEPFEFMATRPLAFDLGIDIDDVESELILNLSRQVDVDVIIPLSEVENDTYADLLSRSQPIHHTKLETTSQFYFKKFSSMLAEVKDAVATTRRWADEGVALEDIAIVSPAVENYWPTLMEYLLVEGIPVNKDVVTPLSQFEIYQTWLSKMRVALGDMQSIDGEQIIFSEEIEPSLNFEEFQRLFANVYEVEDYNRMPEVQKQIPQAIHSDQLIELPDFLRWSFSLLATSQWPSLVSRLADFDDILMIRESLSFEKWIEFFENYFSRTEEKIKNADPKGVSVLSLSAAINQPLKKIYILGLSENNVVERQQTALHWSDIESIKIQFGFNLPHADRFKLIDKLNWLELKNSDEVYFSMSETDFSGQFQSPSLYWLKGAMKEEHSMDLSSPKPTRWDQLMQGGLKNNTEDSKHFHSDLQKFIERDQGEVNCAPVPFKDLSLSASSLEEYFKCPFRLFARKQLRLGNLPSLDLDIDAMTRGRLIHKVCELIVIGGDFDLQASEIEQLVEQARKDIDMPVYNGEMWEFLKPFYLKLTKSFLDYEREWRKDQPATETLFVEKRIKTAITLSNDGFRFDPNGTIPFRGTIDRVDRGPEGAIAILDYKTSAGSLRQYSSWLKNGQLQLALYALALMEGALDGEQYDVVAAFYYVIRGLDRSKGFVLSSTSPQFLPSKKMTRKDLDELLSEAKELVGKLIEDILAGRIEPSPNDETLCDTCDWNKICRYPQLNQ